jgi:hypothetical protein
MIRSFFKGLVERVIITSKDVLEDHVLKKYLKYFLSNLVNVHPKTESNIIFPSINIYKDALNYNNKKCQELFSKKALK